MKQKGLISPPKWLPQNIHYEVITGSVSYAVSSDTSDMDVVGFCIPPKDDVFPHLRGEIMGFGQQQKRFDVWQEHKIVDSPLGDIIRKHDISKMITLKDVEDEISRRLKNKV